MDITPGFILILVALGAVGWAFYTGHLHGAVTKLEAELQKLRAGTTSAQAVGAPSALSRAEADVEAAVSKAIARLRSSAQAAPKVATPASIAAAVATAPVKPATPAPVAVVSTPDLSAQIQAEMAALVKRTA